MPGSKRVLTPENKNPRNPRRISREAIAKLRDALERFGDLGGIILNRRTGRLVGGHQRLEAFAQKKLPARIEQELEEPDATGTVAHGYVVMFGTRYSYREVDWDEKKELAANLAANRHGGDFDWPLVADLLDQIKDSGEMEFTGFSDGELQNLLSAAEWTPEEIAEIEPRPMFSIYLSPAARAALTECKVALNLESDAQTIVEVCTRYLKTIQK